MNRFLKRLVIIGVYFSIIFGILFLIYLDQRPAPSCFDGKKNGREVGVDCGGSCSACAEEITAQDMVVHDARVVFDGVYYDAVITVRNPNTLYGAQNFRYAVDFLSSEGTVIATKESSGWILPQQEQVFAVVGVTLSQKPSRVSVRVLEVNWVAFDSFTLPNVQVENVQYGRVTSGSLYAQALGLVRNRSIYDFQNIDIVIVVRDSSGVPVAVNTTSQQDLQAGDNRDFRVSWPREIPGENHRVSVYLHIDVFDSQNYIQTFLPGSERYLQR